MKKRSKINSKSVILLLFVVVLIGLYFRFYHQSVIKEVYSKVFPTVENGTFSVASELESYDIETDKLINGLKVVLSPGEVFSGSMIVKNHMQGIGAYTIYKDKFALSDNKEKEIEEILVDFFPKEFFVSGEELKYVDFTISIPEDYPLGTYEGKFIVRPTGGSSIDLGVTGDGVKMEAAIGVKVTVDIVSEKYDIRYESVTDNTKEIAWKLLIIRMRYFGAALFGIAAIYYLVLAFKEKAKHK